MYNKTVMDHFRNPRNVGVIEDADGVGEVGNPICGDMMTIYLKINNDAIEDIKFQTFGCGSAIAGSTLVRPKPAGGAGLSRCARGGVPPRPGPYSCRCHRCIG